MEVCRLTPDHVDEYRTLMLEAYSSAPEAFTATVSERERRPLVWWQSRVSDSPDAGELVFGAFVGSRMVGVVGLRFARRQRTKHKATLFGMFVLPSFTEQGLARALVGAVLAKARATSGIRVVQLTVTESNTSAIHLYESCGFRSWGVEPAANRVDKGFVSKVHMWCEVDPDAT